MGFLCLVRCGVSVLSYADVFILFYSSFLIRFLCYTILTMHTFFKYLSDNLINLVLLHMAIDF